jgi:transcription antitermination factor NusG
MPLRWYAVSSKIKTKEKFLKEVLKSPVKSKLREIKDVIAYDFDLGLILDKREDGIPTGYCLIQFDEKFLREIVKAMDTSKIGKFIGTGKTGLPYPIPKEEVVKFQSGVKHKREEFYAGEKVKIIEGILKGFDATVVKKNKLTIVVEVNLPNSTIVRSLSIMSLEKKSRP